MNQSSRSHWSWATRLGKLAWCGLWGLCTLTIANAHEVDSTRLALVQREPTHVSATFYISPQIFFEPVLDAQMATPSSHVHLASLDDEAFAALYAKAQTFYKQKISFKLSKDKPAQLSHWQFATWQSVRRQIQLDLAQQLVNSHAHAHMEPIQFSVQLTSSSELSVLQPKLPLHWGKVLVVASKPQQRWIDSQESSQWIKF